MRKGIFAALILWLGLHVGTASALGDIPPTPTPDPMWNYQGMWWASPGGSEPGWGIFIAHQGSTIRVTWFTYDTDGSPMWLVMSAGRELYSRSEDYYSTLFRATGAPMGTGAFTFTGPDAGAFTYTMNGVVRSKRIEKQVFSTRLPACSVGGARGSAPNYTDLWTLEGGGAIHIAHQGNVLMAAWPTFRADGKAEWLVMSNGARIGEKAYSGKLHRTRGPAFNANPWNASQVGATAVGLATFTFVEDYVNSESSPTYYEFATFDFALDGVAGSRRATRAAFAQPVTVCNGD